MIVCIAEKPSVGRDIAEILGARTRKDGYMEGNGYQVTWTFGHLCGLLEPAEYTPDWKIWALSRLPMIPKPFGIKVVENEGIQKQFRIIEKLISGADEVINCGDAGQEAHQPDLAVGIGDGVDQLVIGPAIEEDRERMDERPEALHREAAGEGQHVLLGHAEGQELFRLPVAKPVDLAGGGEVGR